MTVRWIDGYTPVENVTFWLNKDLAGQGVTYQIVYECAALWGLYTDKWGDAHINNNAIPSVHSCVLTKLTTWEVERVTGTINRIGDAAAVVSAGVQNEIAAGFEAVQQSTHEILDYTEAQVARAGQTQIEFVNRQTELISKSFSDTIFYLQYNLQVLSLSIADSIAALVAISQNSIIAMQHDVSSIINGYASATSDAVHEFSSATTDVVESVNQLIELIREREKSGGALKTPEITGLIAKTVLSVFGGKGDTVEHDVTDTINKELAFALANAEETPIIASLLGGSIGYNDFVKWLTSILSIPFFIKDVLQASTASELNLMQQFYSRNTRFQTLGFDVAVAMQRQGLIPESTVNDQLERQGYHDWQISAIKEFIYARITAGDVIALWLRSEIGEEELHIKLRELGYKDGDIQLLQSLAFFIPPVSDLITMAVREVFSPEIAAKFGQYEDFPQDFAENAAKQGVSEDWAKRYWAAHWNLPSLTMGFEMFQRRIISDDELRLLMKAQDVMPFWRDKLIALSYNPLTRVDVRRMHKLGVLAREDVVNSYRDIGYSPENAELLTQFTETYNEDVSDLGEGKSLALSQVMELLNQRIITDQNAIEILKGMRYDESESAMLVALNNLKRDLGERKQAKENIIQKGKKHIITYEQAQSQLTMLGITGLELEQALIAVSDKSDIQSSVPAQSMLNEMLKSGAISPQQFAEGSIGNGYSDIWIQAFIRHIMGKKHA